MANKTFNQVKINVKFDEASSDVTVSGGNNHASNIDGSVSQNLALALGKIQNWYNNWNSVVWTGNASTIAGHTVGIDVPANAVFTDTTYSTGTGLSLSGTTINHSNSVTAISNITMLKVSYDTEGHITGSTAITKSDITGLGIPSENTTYTLTQDVTDGHIITFTPSSGTANTITIPDNNTTYTFVEGNTNGAFYVTPSGGSTQSVKIHGLGTMAYETASNYILTSTIGANNGIAPLGNDGMIPSRYLPSYVDDVVDGYYNSTTNKFYSDSAMTQEITGESDKIYVDLNTNIPYRWSGSTWVSLSSPSISAVANVVAASTNGKLIVSYTDGTASSEVTAYTHPTTSGNKHIPSGGSSGQILKWSASGTAVWANADTTIADYQGSTSSAAGVHGLVPYAASGTQGTHYLRADGTWSSDPVIESDILTLNVVAGS